MRLQRLLFLVVCRCFAGMLESEEVVGSPTWVLGTCASPLCTLNMSDLCSPNSLSMVFLMSPSQYTAIAMSGASGHRLSTVCVCAHAHACTYTSRHVYRSDDSLSVDSSTLRQGLSRGPH